MDLISEIRTVESLVEAIHKLSGAKETWTCSTSSALFRICAKSWSGRAQTRSASAWTRSCLRPRPFREAAESCSPAPTTIRSEEHTSELQSLMRISYAVFCLNNKTHTDALHLTSHPLHRSHFPVGTL